MGEALVCRGADVVARYGGEEFVVLLPNCSLEEGVREAEEFRSAVRSMAAQAGGRALERIAISIGIAAFPASGCEAVSLLAAPDKPSVGPRRKGGTACRATLRSRWSRRHDEMLDVHGDQSAISDRRRERRLIGMPEPSRALPAEKKRFVEKEEERACLDTPSAGVPVAPKRSDLRHALAARGWRQRR